MVSGPFREDDPVSDENRFLTISKTKKAQRRTTRKPRSLSYPTKAKVSVVPESMRVLWYKAVKLP